MFLFYLGFTFSIRNPELLRGSSRSFSEGLEPTPPDRTVRRLGHDGLRLRPLAGQTGGHPKIQSGIQNLFKAFKQTNKVKLQ